VLDRRRLLKGALLGIPGASVLLGRLSNAEELEPLSESDALARSLDYHADAKTVDSREYPEYEVTQSCATCLHFQPAAGSVPGCKLVPGKSVSPGGWCKLWELHINTG
jgi:hypothetical protein